VDAEQPKAIGSTIGKGPFMIGRRLGHYEITEKLGEGGMGTVYRARDTTLGRDVALKLLPASLAGDRERVARLEREAHLLASLNHPNIATLHGLEESDRLKYLVMELVPGETLAERISREPLNVEECLGILRQIAEALEAAHEKGIIHRDLKPANVVVTPEARAKVLDFGLAKAVAEEAPPSDLSSSPTRTREGTEHGVILGTASYMSPEQARGKTLDRRTDIWSFGCVFFEALTGRKAFPGGTVSDTIAAILEKDPDWTALPARTPGKIRDLIRRCLQKDPHRRLQHIGDARVEIDEALAEPSTPAVTAPRRSYLPWAVAALLAVVAVWSLLRPGTEPERAVLRFTVTLPPEQALNWEVDPSVSLSPDGTYLVYVGGVGDERRLYIRSFDRLEARPIPGTEGATTAFFSPDGEWVGFYGNFYDEVKLKKVALDSGLPITLTDVHDAWGASWGPGDEILFSDGSGLSRVSASGGSPSVVTSPDPKQGETWHRWPEILPNGKTALFTILMASGTPRIGVLSLETGEYRILLEDGGFARYVRTGHLVYVTEGVLTAVPFDLGRLELTGEPVPILEGVRTEAREGTAHFAFSANGTLVYVPLGDVERTLVSVDRMRAVRRIGEARRRYYAPRISPDGEKIAVNIGDHIWIYEALRDAFTRLTFGPNEERWPVWTPDGSRITFQRDDPPNIFWQPADGSGEAERLTTGERQRPTSWSSDGKILLYTTLGSATGTDIGVLTLEGERKTRTLLGGAFDEMGGVFSPDGRFFAYTSNESGEFEVYVRSFPSLDGRQQISNDGGFQPVWARSGREIFYRNGDKMMVVAVDTNPAFRAARPVFLFEEPFENIVLPAGSNYDVTPDDERFVMAWLDEAGPTQIQVVLNWFEELKARVPSGKR
jgi:serine/threonine-protein kinase